MNFRIVTIFESYPLNAAVRGMAMDLGNMPTSVAVISVDQISFFMPASGLAGALPGLPGDPGEIHLKTGEVLYTPDVEATADEIILAGDAENSPEIPSFGHIAAREVGDREGFDYTGEPEEPHTHYPASNLE